MLDRYTKVVLTVIAVALSVIAWTNLRPSMQAYAQLAGCTMDRPCVVGLKAHTLTQETALPVYVMNFPKK